MKEFSDNTFLSNLETLEMQKRIEMQAGTFFFLRWLSKKHREKGGGVGGTASTAGRKLA